MPYPVGDGDGHLGIAVGIAGPQVLLTEVFATRPHDVGADASRAGCLPFARQLAQLADTALCHGLDGSIARSQTGSNAELLPRTSRQGQPTSLC